MVTTATRAKSDRPLLLIELSLADTDIDRPSRLPTGTVKREQQQGQNDLVVDDDDNDNKNNIGARNPTDADDVTGRLCSVFPHKGARPFGCIGNPSRFCFTALVFHMVSTEGLPARRVSGLALLWKGLVASGSVVGAVAMDEVVDEVVDEVSVDTRSLNVSICVCVCQYVRECESIILIVVFVVVVVMLAALVALVVLVIATCWSIVVLLPNTQAQAQAQRLYPITRLKYLSQTLGQTSNTVC